MINAAKETCHLLMKILTLVSHFELEGVMVPWCNPLTLQPELSGGVGSTPL